DSVARCVPERLKLRAESKAARALRPEGFAQLAKCDDALMQQHCPESQCRRTRRQIGRACVAKPARRISLHAGIGAEPIAVDVQSELRPADDPIGPPAT